MRGLVDMAFALRPAASLQHAKQRFDRCLVACIRRHELAEPPPADEGALPLRKVVQLPPAVNILDRGQPDLIFVVTEGRQLGFRGLICAEELSAMRQSSRQAEDVSIVCEDSHCAMTPNIVPYSCDSNMRADVKWQ